MDLCKYPVISCNMVKVYTRLNSLIIPNNYTYRLTCRFLADLGRGSVAVRLYQAGNHTKCSLSYSFGNADERRANHVDT